MYSYIYIHIRFLDWCYMLRLFLPPTAQVVSTVLEVPMTLSDTQKQVLHQRCLDGSASPAEEFPGFSRFFFHKNHRKMEVLMGKP